VGVVLGRDASTPWLHHRLYHALLSASPGALHLCDGNETTWPAWRSGLMPGNKPGNGGGQWCYPDHSPCCLEQP
jgi:hypothetical protein